MSIENPFLKGLNKGSEVTAIIMKRLNGGNKAQQPPGNARNLFLDQAASGQEDQENKRNSANVTTSPTPPVNIMPVVPPPPHRTIPHPVQPVLPVEPTFSASGDRAQLEVKVNGQACQVNKQKDVTLKNVGQLVEANVKVTLPESLRLSISRAINTTNHLLNCLSPLYELISENNHTISETVIKCQKFRLPTSVQLRLKQGLSFYKPVQNNAMEVLKCTLEGHPLGRATQLISQRCNLDTLKAYYIARSVHQNKKLIQPGNRSFIIKNPFTPLPDDQIMKEAETYLEFDKFTMLNLYLLLLERLSRRLRILKYREEVDVLWGNLWNFARESPLIQQKIIEVFIKYWKASFEEDNRFTEQLYFMRQKIHAYNMTNGLRTKFTAIIVEGLLKEEGVERRLSQFEGPFQEIHQFFFGQYPDRFDFKIGFQSLKKIEVSKQWCIYIENYIKTNNFGKDDDFSLLRCLFIFEMLRKMKQSQKKSVIPLKLQEELATKIIKSCSVVMAIILLNNVCVDVSKPSLAASLMQYSEKDLKYHFIKDTRLIFEFMPCFNFEQLMKDNISIIQRIIKKTIEIGDIETLQRQVSNGKIFWFDANEQDGNYHFIKVYCQYFLKCPSFQSEIQTNINQLLKFIKDKNMPITKSLETYHMKMLTVATNPIILESHLAFLYEITSDYKLLCQYSTDWLSRVQSQGIAQSFSNPQLIISLVGKKLMESDEHSLFSIYLMCIRIFTNALQAFAQQTSSYFQAVNTLYEISKVFEWSRINNSSSQLLERICVNIKEAIRKQTHSYNELLKKVENISPQLRLFMACQMTNEREKLTQCLSSSSSFQQDYRYEFICKISEDLKKQAGNVVLQTFSLAAKYDGQLFNFLMNKNLANLSELLKNSDANVSILNHILVLGIQIATSSTLTKSQKSSDAYSLLNVVVMRVLRSSKDRSLPVFIYLKLFRLCAACMNKLNYITHMDCLKRGLKGISQVEIRGEMDERFCQYFVYLICLFIARLRHVDMGKADDRTRIIAEFQVFRVLTDLTLQSQKTLPQVSLYYLQKYIQVVEFFLGYPQMFEPISQQFSITVDSFQRRIKNSGEFRELAPLFERVQNLLQGQTTDTVLKQNKHFSNSMSQMYNTTVQKSFNSVAKTRVKEDRKREMQQTIKMLQSSQETKVKLNYSLSISTILDERSTVGIQLMAELVRKVAWEDCPKETGKQFKVFLSEYNMKVYPSLTHEWISAFKSYIDIYNQLVDSSVFSNFILFAGSVKETLSSGFHQLSQGMHFCPAPPSDNRLFASLNNIELNLNYLPMSWRSRSRQNRDVITLWELMVFRLKITLVSTIIRFYRLMNGLLPNHCLIINEITSFLAFFAENASEFQAGSNKEKIRIANDVIERGRGMKEDGNELRQKIDLDKLKNECIAIGESLQYLNVDVPLKTYETLSKLSYAKTV